MNIHNIAGVLVTGSYLIHDATFHEPADWGEIEEEFENWSDAEDFIWRIENESDRAEIDRVLAYDHDGGEHVITKTGKWWDVEDEPTEAMLQAEIDRAYGH